MALQAENGHILVAEDDDDDFDFFSTAMEYVNKDISITRAKNGEILMIMLKNLIPDVLFLDVQMPCKDGRTCLREIRADSRYDSLPIIMFSDYDDPRIIESCYEGKSNRFAIKPTTIRGIIKIIREVFDTDWKKHFYSSQKGGFVIEH